MLPSKTIGPVERLSVLIAAVGLLALTILALVTIIDIAGREVFRTPINGFSDIADLLVVFAAAACFPISLVERHHVAVRFLGQLHWRLREVLELLGHSLLLAVFAIICWQLVHYTLDVYRSGQTTWLIGIPVWPLWTATTIVIAVCIPIQGMVVLQQAQRALSRAPIKDHHTPHPEDTVEVGGRDGSD